MAFDNRSIGVFDSGLGGLTSVREIEKILPNENIIYFGDTGRVPYGTRSPETILKYSRDDLRFLLKHNIKAVLIACGTVSSIALDDLSADSPVPLLGVVKPASEMASELAFSKKSGIQGNIAVLGTQATAKNGAYEREILKCNPDANVFPVACPMFVPLVENGYIDTEEKNNPVTLLVAKEYIGKLTEFRPASLILGCTHYPLIRNTIEKACLSVLGYLPEIVDAGACAAGRLKELLDSRGLLSERHEKGNSEFFVSDETQNFSASASAFLGRKIENVTKIEIEKE